MLHEFVADFETTSCRVYKEVVYKGQKRKKLDNINSRAFVCAFGIAEISATTNEEVYHGRNINQFLSCVVDIKNSLPKRDKMTVFTHNLKFDGAFIIYNILKTNCADLQNEVRDNSLYSFDLVFPGGEKITFRDSSKIFPCSVAKLGELYGIKKLSGDWDYSKYRDDYTPILPEEWGYIDHDVLIVCKALHDYRLRGFTQNTLAAIAYNNRLQQTYTDFKKSRVSIFKKSNYELFRKTFPFDIMPLERKAHVACLNAYFGGWCWLNPHYYLKELRNTHSYDENSMYPDKMRNYILPVGKPHLYKNPTEADKKEINIVYPLQIWHITDLSVKLKNEWALPTLMFPTIPETSVRCQGKVIKCEHEEVWLTNIDIKMMKQEYDIISGSFDFCIAFKGKKGQYKKFVDFWMKEKEEATNEANTAKPFIDSDEMLSKYLNAMQRRDISKKMMNSSYGKDGTKLFRLAKNSYLDEFELLEERRKVEETVIEYYIPSAVFITAWSRYDLHNINKIAGKSFIYSDTDSSKVTSKGDKLLKIAAECGKLKIHDTELGAWKHEAVYQKAKFVRQKTYAVFESDKWEYTVCGATGDVKKLMKIEDFRPGMLISLDDLHNAGLEGKLVPISVPGGVILDETPFQISPVEDWDEIGSKNLPIEYFIKYMRGGKY